MTDEDKEEVKRWFESWIESTEVEQRVRKIIKWTDTDKHLERYRQWADRIPFLVIGLGFGILIGIIIIGVHLK